MDLPACLCPWRPQGHDQKQQGEAWSADTGTMNKTSAAQCVGRWRKRRLDRAGALGLDSKRQGIKGMNDHDGRGGEHFGGPHPSFAKCCLACRSVAGFERGIQKRRR